MSTFAELFSAIPGDGAAGEYLVRWRGREEGPYSVFVIESKLASNQIGLLHEILRDGQWITIRDHMAEREATLRAEQTAREERERRTRGEMEQQARMIEAQQREVALAEEKRRNDLLESAAKPPDFSKFLQQDAISRGSSKSRGGVSMGVFKAIIAAACTVGVVFFVLHGCSLH